MKNSTAGAAMSVRLFGSFELSGGGRVLTEEDFKSEMMVKLTAYLILRRGHSSTFHEIIDALWPDLESENPQGALKNLVYRTRRKLESLWPGRDFILTSNGGYIWNTAFPVELDTEKFKTFCAALGGIREPVRKIGMIRRILELYRGRLLESFSDEYWVLPRQTWFHNSWISAVHMCTDLLETRQDYPMLEKICRKAILIDDRDEVVHCALLKSLIGENRISAAEEHYRRTIQVLYTKDGNEIPETLRNLYSRMMEQHRSEELDLLKIHEELMETESLKGAYFCEFENFRKIYEVSTRRMKRSGRPHLLVLISMVIDGDADESEYPALEQQRRADMNRLKGRLMKSLRSGDVLTRYSQSQYLIMLPECPKENAEDILKRVFHDYYMPSGHSRLRIQYNLKEITS